MKNLITTLLFIVICTNAISQDQAVIKQPSYPDVESDLVIQIKEQGEEIQKLKEENERLEELIKKNSKSQDVRIDDSTSHFNSWLTYAATLISFLGVLATIFCAFSAWKIHITEVDVKKQLKYQSRFIKSNLATLKIKCQNLNNQLLEAEKFCRNLKDTGVEKIIDLKNEKNIQISKIFAQYADKKRRNMEDDHEFKEEINKYIDNLEKTNGQGGYVYNDEDWIYLGLKYYIDKKYQEVGLYWGKVSDKYDKYAYVLMLWGNALIHCAISEKRSELFKQGCEKYKSAIKLDNKDERIFSNWANALADWALIDKDPVFFNDSFEKYDLAVKISPASSYIYYNWGVALYDYAKSEFVEKKMIPRLYKQSCEKYKLATQIDPLDDDAFINWGIALASWAELNNDEKLYLESFEKYKKASEINPNDSSIYKNWGVALYNYAQINNEIKLYMQSFEKYQKASEINSTDASIFNSWGGALLTLAKSKTNISSHKQEIKSILLKAEAIKEGSGSYNLACLYSLLDQKDTALIWFEKDLKYGSSQTKDEILSDSDLDNIKSDPQFKELMDKYFLEK